MIKKKITLHSTHLLEIVKDHNVDKLSMQVERNFMSEPGLIFKISWGLINIFQVSFSLSYRITCGLFASHRAGLKWGGGIDLPMVTDVGNDAALPQTTVPLLWQLTDVD